jgi:predicted HAD superfamily phosphohydrolase YqeG
MNTITETTQVVKISYNDLQKKLLEATQKRDTDTINEAKKQLQTRRNKIIKKYNQTINEYMEIKDFLLADVYRKKLIQFKINIGFFNSQLKAYVN